MMITSSCIEHESCTPIQSRVTQLFPDLSYVVNCALSSMISLQFRLSKTSTTHDILVTYLNPINRVCTATLRFELPTHLPRRLSRKTVSNQLLNQRTCRTRYHHEEGDRLGNMSIVRSKLQIATTCTNNCVTAWTRRQPTYCRSAGR